MWLVTSGKSGPKDQVALHYYCSSVVLLLYFAFALLHDSRGIEIVDFTVSLALSAGTLMASAGTPYRLVPAHFYPCLSRKSLLGFFKEMYLLAIGSAGFVDTRM